MLCANHMGFSIRCQVHVVVVSWPSTKRWEEPVQGSQTSKTDRKHQAEWVKIAVAVAVFQRGQSTKLFQRWWKKHRFSGNSHPKLLYSKCSVQECPWTLHVICRAGSCPTPSQWPPLHTEGPGKEGVSWQQAPHKAGLSLLERQQDTMGVVHLLYNAPEARAPRQLVYSSEPI